MADQILSPIAQVQNPAFGAALIWKFVRGYEHEKPGSMPVLQLLFLVLPIILHRLTMEKVKSTNQSSGLAKFVEKLGDERELLFSIHDRALGLRGLTLDSISTGIVTRLLSIDYDLGTVHGNEASFRNTPERLKHHLSSAEKLGRWSARLPSGHVFSLLKVEP
ncbi:hypothetical protein FHT77_001792 [Rhizobium sp. BK181]|uniref:three component ABC system middle component n=1 Tax=Rhizobium sp. BK181 TaxID=2587072 RepID=UPI00160D4653|nr:three component ABC system middle component [Rhizobium sp. BK181]MBB3315927.1 hypothetical protein [Rhizobium sp. BK181]